MAVRATSANFDHAYFAEYRACLRDHPELDAPGLHQLTFETLAKRYAADRQYAGLLHLLKEQLEPYMIDLYRKPLDLLREHLGDAKTLQLLDGQVEAWFDEVFDRLDKGGLDDFDRQRVQDVIAFAEDFLGQRHDEATGLRQALALLKENGKRPPLVEIDDPRDIDNPLFWELLDDAVRFTPKTAVRCRWLRDRLTGFKARAIVQFARELNAEVVKRYSYRNWGVAFLVNGGSSDEGLQSFLGWLLLQGRAFVEQFDADPDAILEKPDEDDYEEERIYYVPEDAFYRVSSKEFPENAILKLPRKLVGRAWKAEELPTLFPRVHHARLRARQS